MAMTKRMQRLLSQEQRIVSAGGVKVKPRGRAEAWNLGSKLIWLIDGKQVLVGYAHNPEQQGVIIQKFGVQPSAATCRLIKGSKPQTKRLNSLSAKLTRRSPNYNNTESV